MKHFGFLLRVSRGSVKLVLFLDSCLEWLLSMPTTQPQQILTGSSSQAAINASYGLLKAVVEIPVRSSKVLVWLPRAGTWPDIVECLSQLY